MTVIGEFEHPPKDGERFSSEYTCGKLFTWNSTWLLGNEQYQNIVKKWLALPHVLITLAKTVPEVQALFNEFRQVVVDAVRKFRCREWSICMEVSLHSSECGRVHLHGFLERNCKVDRAWFPWHRIESC